MRGGMGAKRRWYDQDYRPGREGTVRRPGSPSSGSRPTGRRRMLQDEQGASGPVTRRLVDPDSIVLQPKAELYRGNTSLKPGNRPGAYAYEPRHKVPRVENPETSGG